MRFAVCLLVAACGGGNSSVTRVELGTGTNEFMALPASGANLELVHGPQGGWHLTVALMVWSADPAGPNDVTLVYEARTAGGDVLGSTELMVDAIRFLRDQDHWLRLGDSLVLDITGPASVVGSAVELSASADGATQRKQVTVVDEVP